ncbi:MAG: hypothetical protein HY075_06255 [Deltaproteobacteria bacterium]|nr:hypothetical protein [Deltaproteobacteria bacterium]
MPSCRDALAVDMAVGEFGLKYHGGATGKSWNGGLGEYLYFQSQAGKGVFRPNVGAAIEFISGNASVGSSTVSGTAFSGGIWPGVDMFPFRTEKFQPFIEVHGVMTWNYAALSPLATKSDETSIGLLFGYQIGGGTDIRVGKGERAIRIHTSYSAYSGKIAGQAGFQFNAFALGLGLVF